MKPKPLIGLAFSLILLGMSTCVRSNALDELQFEDAETGQRFLELDACIHEYTSEDTEWRTSGYERSSKFSFESRWCRGGGTLDECRIKSSYREKRDQHIIRLSTDFDSYEDTQASGLSLYVLRVPAEGGWAVALHYKEGETVWVNFWYNESAYFDPDEEIERISIVGPFSYKIFETTIRTPDTLSLSSHDKMAKVLESPESMRDIGIHYYQAIAAEVDASLRSGDIPACDYEEYQGDGIPPACTPRPFADDELAAELKHAEEYFAGQQILLQENYREMYAVLFHAFPFDACWP